MAENTKSYLVGVDLGGTKILAGVFDDRLGCCDHQPFECSEARRPVQPLDIGFNFSVDSASK